MVILQQALATLVNPSDPAFGRATSLYTPRILQQALSKSID